MEYKVDNKYYKLGVLITRIPRSTDKYLPDSYFLTKIFGKTGGSFSLLIAFKNLEKLFNNNKTLLEELRKLKEEFTEEDYKLFIKYGTNIGNPKNHITKEDEEMFLRGLLARK